MNENPYQAPVGVAFTPSLHSADSEAIAIREAHIGHEASVKGVGFLQIIFGALIILGGIAVIGDALLVPSEESQFMAMAGGFYLAIGIFSIFTGSGLRGLRIWARIVTIVISSLVLLFALMGLIIPPHWPALVPLAMNLYIVLMMASAKSRMVFSDQYKQIIAVTPWMRYRSKLLWILLVILVLFILLTIVFTARGLR